MERSKTEKLQDQIIALQKELDSTQKSCLEEMNTLKKIKLNVVEERVAHSRAVQNALAPRDSPNPNPNANPNPNPNAFRANPGIQNPIQIPQNSRSKYRIDLKNLRRETWTAEEREEAQKLEMALDREFRKLNPATLIYQENVLRELNLNS